MTRRTATSQEPRGRRPPRATASATSLARYGCGPVKFTGTDDALYERRLVFDHVVDPKDAGPREQFEAVAAAIRDVLSQRWVRTQQEYDRANPKQVYYLSMEFLIGRSLANNITNLMLSPLVDAAAREKGLKLAELLEQEPDAGLGNGGLGRLAACFIESMATMAIPAIGYGLRYDYGIFRQEIRDGSQVEHPDHWLSRPDPWEVARPNETVDRAARLAGSSRTAGVISVHRGQASHLLGVPYDRPVVGYGGRTINTLRLWQAATPDVFDFGEFSGGDFFGAVSDRVLAETVSRVLYPDDSTPRGRSLRFVQEYFLVACSLADIVARFLRRGNDWPALAGQGRHPAQRHPPGDGRGRADAHPARPGRSSAGTRRGTSRSAPWRTPTTRCCRRPWRSGRSSCSRPSSPGSWRSSTRSTGASWTPSGRRIPATRRRSPG